MWKYRQTDIETINRHRVKWKEEYKQREIKDRGHDGVH